MYLIVNLVFPTSVFWSRDLFLIALLPNHCLLLPLSRKLIDHTCELIFSLFIIYRFSDVFVGSVVPGVDIFDIY